MNTCEGKRPVLYYMSVPSACPFIEHLVCSRTFAPRSALSSFSYLSHHDLHFTFILFINTSANISKYALEHQNLSLQEISCKGIMQILRQVVKWKSYTTEMGCGFGGYRKEGFGFSNVSSIVSSSRNPRELKMGTHNLGCISDF